VLGSTPECGHVLPACTTRMSLMFNLRIVQKRTLKGGRMSFFLYFIAFLFIDLQKDQYMTVENELDVEVCVTEYGMQNPELLKLMLESAERKRQELKSFSNHKENNVESTCNSP